MWCTRWFLPLLLLPLPTAPPFFLVLFLFSLTMHAKPCFYCIILLTTLFISSCYWQPFPTDTPLSTPWSENISTFADAINATLSPNLPHPSVIRAADRCWCDLTSGAFFEPFNVSHWEHLSVQRLKDSLEKRQKASEEELHKLMEPRGDLEQDRHSPYGRNSVAYKVWSVLRDLSPGFYNSFSKYMIPLEEEVGIMESEVNPPSPPLPSPEPPKPRDTPHPTPAPNAEKLPLIRKEYDLNPYGFDMVLDFSWSR
ncbi:hypothetical protein NP233_g516 [Leucocoprinus birnbaumii]|uniref:Uncharacterized protein n=1 Tax=Leucocoprinus birnbaumii TaxID=56174 RepID=A0AAD5YVP2_9AGAR|nr:hypothetical protein NP233_g516 [Leucocoprinus birnbaumii]